MADMAGLPYSMVMFVLVPILSPHPLLIFRKIAMLLANTPPAIYWRIAHAPIIGAQKFDQQGTVISCHYT